MKKVLTILTALLLTASLTGCDEKVSNQVEIKSSDVKTKCINGVEYYLFVKTAVQGYRRYGYGFMAPAFGRDGKIITCEGETINQVNSFQR